MEQFVGNFADFISTQPAAAGFDEIHIIANPVAGGFIRHSAFAEAVDKLEARGRQADTSRVLLSKNRIHIHRTHSPGDCETIVHGLISAKAGEKKMLLITAGGDGTATEAASEVHRYIQESGNGENTVLFRMPMGTGNDGLDADTMDTAFAVCSSECTAAKIPLLQIDSASGIRKYATNIASFGLDAYVTDKTNKLKRIIPGSFYSVMVDVAALFYEFSVDMVPLELHYTDYNGEAHTDNPVVLLLAMGVSGNRTYGGGKLVLPGRENVCTIGRMKLGRKFTVKEILYKGEHTALDEVAMYEAREMSVNFSGAMLFQHDGEVIPLKKEDFPVKLRILQPSVPVLRPKDLTILKDLRGISG